MMIFLFFIIKQFGVHSIILNMIEVNVSMHIIGKIIGENPRSTPMNLFLVYLGNQMNLFKNTKMPVPINIIAQNVMDGKSLNIIQKLTELKCALREISVLRARRVPTTTMHKRKGNKLIFFFFFLKFTLFYYLFFFFFFFFFFNT